MHLPKRTIAKLVIVAHRQIRVLRLASLRRWHVWIRSRFMQLLMDAHVRTRSLSLGLATPHEGRQAHVVPSWFIESLQCLALKFARPEDALRADACRCHPSISFRPSVQLLLLLWGRLMLMGHSLITKATKTGHYSVCALDGILIQ